MATVCLPISGQLSRAIVRLLLPQVLMAMSPLFGSWLAPDGRLILSGIIDERADEVENHFKKAGFSIERRVERDGWTMLLAAHA